MRSVDEVLAAASAALSVALAAPRDLDGNEQSTVLRCLLPDGGSVIVKAYSGSGQGRECFAAEAAGLELTAANGFGPRLLAATACLVVMTDLGTAPSLADVLLSGSAATAEAALPAFLDAAYLRMPFSTCWCVFRLPDGVRRRAERGYRDLVSQVHPDLARDAVWLPGVRLGVAAWTLHAMTYLLDQALMADMSMIDDGRAAPTKRQLLRYRWRRLIAELEPAGPGEPEYPALRALAARLLARTEHWRVRDLPAYPAFRNIDLTTNRRRHHDRRRDRAAARTLAAGTGQ